ncbi:hypothetical protein IG631_24091 [Alternaria alternata]|nr:hypothetical protein IG631_24091 [Alternaria alternata]
MRMLSRASRRAFSTRMEKTQAPLESFAQRADLPESIVSSCCCVRPLSLSEQGEQDINETLQHDAKAKRECSQPCRAVFGDCH